MTTISHEWVTGPDAWHAFVQEHPELGYPTGKWGFHNFLRRYREPLVKVDAIRLAKGRFWVAHISRFSRSAFECATGRSAAMVQRQAALGCGTLWQPDPAARSRLAGTDAPGAVPLRDERRPSTGPLT